MGAAETAAKLGHLLGAHWRNPAFADAGAARR
jgi:hypothetical protein